MVCADDPLPGRYWWRGTIPLAPRVPVRARHAQLHHVAHPRQRHVDREDGALLSVRARVQIPQKRQAVPRHPDIVLPKYRTIVFVNGCFWHMHEGCESFHMPKSNVEFWAAKLTRNRDRDRRQHEQLRQMGWRVIDVWECELRGDAREARLERLVGQIAEGV